MGRVNAMYGYLMDDGTTGLGNTTELSGFRSNVMMFASLRPHSDTPGAGRSDAQPAAAPGVRLGL